MRNFCSLFGGLALLAGTLAAQPAYTIKLTVAGPSGCTNAPALSLGTDASASVIGSGAGASLGRTTFGGFSLTRSFDDCSIALLRALFLGSHLPPVTISVF